MIHAPMGIWLSFIDMPWKAVTVGFAVADEIADAQPDRTDSRRSDRKAERQVRPAEATKSMLVVLVGIGSILYPILILAIVGICAFQAGSGRTVSFCMVGGTISLGATILYGIGILLLNSIQELRFVMVLISPGFGWAFMFIGSITLIVSGVFRRDRIR
jgi:hypothetical protein